MIYERNGDPEIAALFGGWQETMIWSCLQGVMGRLYADSAETPESAMAILGDFCFFAGKPSAELVSYKPDWCTQDFIIMTACAPDWFEVIEAVYGERAKKVSRYAFRKDPDAFDQASLRAFAEAVPEGYALRMIDREFFDRCQAQDWSRDFVSLFDGYEQYEECGLGVVALWNGEIVAGASSYSSYLGGIEIEIDTEAEHRRRGLATACAARLMLECQNRGLYPSWDAQNLWSVALAKKLGYQFDHEYTAYEIKGY